MSISLTTSMDKGSHEKLQGIVNTLLDSYEIEGDVNVRKQRNQTILKPEGESELEISLRDDNVEEADIISYNQHKIKFKLGENVFCICYEVDPIGNKDTIGSLTAKEKYDADNPLKLVSASKNNLQFRVGSAVYTVEYHHIQERYASYKAIMDEGIKMTRREELLVKKICESRGRPVNKEFLQGSSETKISEGAVNSILQRFRAKLETTPFTLVNHRTRGYTINYRFN